MNATTTYQPAKTDLAAVAKAKDGYRWYVARPRLDDSFATVEVWERSLGGEWEVYDVIQGRTANLDRLTSKARKIAVRAARDWNRG